MMNYKLIKLKEGYIIVSNKKEKADSITKWYYEEDNNIQCYQFCKKTLPKEYYLNEVIASTFIDELPDIDFNNLEEEFGIITVEELVLKEFPIYKKDIWEEDGLAYNEDIHKDYREGYIKGFNKCLELNKDKLYTEENLREAIAESWVTCEDNEDKETFTQVFNRIIQSLQPKTEWDIEIELETKCYCGHTSYCECGELENKPFVQRPKINNNQIKILKIK